MRKFGAFNPDYRMHHTRRVDSNHRQVVEALQKIGASVQSLHTVGKGCPDLVVGFRGRNYLMEVKDGSKPPSARKLTPDEERWIGDWQGHVVIVCSIDDALNAVMR